jgi:uncharacterized protein (TIGR03437 family)
MKNRKRLDNKQMQRCAVAVLLALQVSLVAQTAISTRGVVNAASSAPGGLANGAIAQGSIFTIYGTQIGPSNGATASSFPLGSSLQGVSITISQGQTEVNAIPVYVGAGQINAIMPSNAPLGMQPVKVSYNGQTSNSSPVRIVNTAVGFFTANGSGAGPGAIQHNADGSINSTLVTAKAGAIVTVYGTGLGAISTPDNQAPPVANAPAPVALFVGGVSAKVFYSGRSPCCAGLDQITFQVPDGAPVGCWVPVYAQAAGVTTNAVTMAIDPNGAPCTEPANPLAQKFLLGGNIGVLQLFRSTLHEDSGVAATLDDANDVFYYDFASVAANPFGYSFLFSAPPVGSCNLLTQPGDFWADKTPGPATPPMRLNPGSSFTIKGPSESQPLDVDPAARALYIGTFAPFAPGLLNRLSLTSGNYTVSGAGGSAVGPFQVQLALPAMFSWTNRDQVALVDRTQQLTVEWSGTGPKESLGIVGGNVDLPTNSSAIFYCVAPPGASSFTIPAEVLEALPASRFNPLASKGALFLFNVSLANGVPFSASGLDTAIATTGYLEGRTVMFQ